jgi:hypothetical protein
MPGTRENTIADRNPDSMHDPDSRVNPTNCTKDAEEPNQGEKARQSRVLPHLWCSVLDLAIGRLIDDQAASKTRCRRSW